MSTSRFETLTSFVHWCNAYITGDEKGQAQVYLDRLFQAFGHAGSLDVGGEAECRIRKAKEDGGGTSFADYVWKPVALIEMKKRGENLAKHYRQAFDYWTRLVPGRPRYVILCNFDEFWIYDFETQMDSPVGRTSLVDLPQHYGPLAFLFPGNEKPVFDNERVAVTRDAAAKLAKVFNRLINRGVERPLAQRFILQMLIAFFAEDIGLIEKYFVTRLLGDCDSANSFDVIGGLFRAMNNRPGNAGGKFKNVPYFNGGIFRVPAEIELTAPELAILHECARDFDWSKVQPEIFGTVFEQTLSKGERHAQGAHFTHPADIMKIVGPTIVEPWREQIKEAKTARRLGELLERLHHFRVLDPACGSGNFLYIAYRELKRIEAQIFDRLDNEFPSKAAGEQMRMSFLSAQNFFGLDQNPFAVELAKVTMMIARKLAIDELHITERALPLDNLDSNFYVTDALVTTTIDEAITRTLWPAADVIIGNPPFLGAKRLKPELGTDYVNKVRKAYPEVPGMADFCVYWIRRVHDHLLHCTSVDPLAGRAGLVGTQNIRNNASRVGGLDHVVKNGTIVEAVDNQPWSGEANVHVSIVNWVKSQDKALLPKVKRLWFKVEPTAAQKKQWRKEGKNVAKEFDLSFRSVTFLNSTLSDQATVSGALPLKCNFSPKCVFQGITPGHKGFVLNSAQCRLIKKSTEKSELVIFPYLIGREIVNGDGTPRRWVIDFRDMDILEAKGYHGAFERIKDLVLEDMRKKASEEHDSESAHKQHLERWWLHWRRRADMKAAIENLGGRYITGSRTQRWPFVFSFMSSDVLPGDKMQVFAFDDDYSFAVIQSAAHLVWYKAKSARLKNEQDYNYSSESVFNTFPWPQNPTARSIAAAAAAGREVRRIREDFLPKIKGGLRSLYRTLELPGANPLKSAHAALDSAILTAYGFSEKKDILSQLLELNKEVAIKIKSGQPVTAPGLPLSCSKHQRFITDDCIQAPAN